MGVCIVIARLVVYSVAHALWLLYCLPCDALPVLEPQHSTSDSSSIFIPKLSSSAGLDVTSRVTA